MPRNFQWTAVTLACLLVSPWAQAQLTAIVAVEPTAKKAAHTIVRSALETGLTQAAGQPLKLSTSEDLADVMRATRSAGYDVFIGLHRLLPRPCSGAMNWWVPRKNPSNTC